MTNAHDAKAREIAKRIGYAYSNNPQCEAEIYAALRDCEREKEAEIERLKALLTTTGAIAHIAEVKRETLEKAARVGRETFENAHEDVYDLGDDIERAIRALAQEEPKT